MTQRWFPGPMMCVLLGCNLAAAQEAQILVHADQVSGRVSRYLTGACIEDVNHEIYGGLYSQMIFGESFQEPPPAVPPKGFTAYGGAWRVKDEVLWADAGDGPKLIADQPVAEIGEVGVEVFLPGSKGGNAGLILKLSEPGVGADKFTASPWNRPVGSSSAVIAKTGNRSATFRAKRVPIVGSIWLFGWQKAPSKS